MLMHFQFHWHEIPITPASKRKSVGVMTCNDRNKHAKYTITIKSGFTKRQTEKTDYLFSFKGRKSTLTSIGAANNQEIAP